MNDYINLSKEELITRLEQLKAQKGNSDCFAALYHQVPIAMAYFDIDGFLSSYNEAFVKLLQVVEPTTLMSAKKDYNIFEDEQIGINKPSAVLKSASSINMEYDFSKPSSITAKINARCDKAYLSIKFGQIHTKASKSCYFVICEEITAQHDFIKELTAKQKNIDEVERLTQTAHWELDIETQLISCSNYACDILGIPHDTPIPAEKIHAMMHEDYQTILEQELSPSWEPGVKHSAKFKAVVNGQIHHIRSISSSIADESGKIIKSVGYWQDISEKIEQENKNDENLKRLEETQAIANLGYWDYNPATDMFECSHLLVEMFWLENVVDEANQISSKALFKHIGSKICSAKELFAPLQKNATNTAVDKIINPYTGEKKYLQRTCFLNYNENGELINIRGISQDITPRVLIEQKLRALEHERTLILDNIKNGVMFNNPDRTITWANPIILEKSNLSNEEIVGQTCYETLFGTDQVCENCPFEDALKGESVIRRRMCAPDGTIIYKSAIPVYNDDKSIKGVVITIEDVTELIEQKEALNTLNQKLKLLLEHQEMLVASSMAMLANNNINNLIDSALKYLLDTTKSTSAYFFELSPQTKTFKLTQSFIKEDKKININECPVFPEAVSEQICARLNSERIVKLDTHDINADPTNDSFAYMTLEGIKAILIAAVHTNGELHGFIGVNEHENSKTWSKDEIRFIHALANLISLSIERKVITQNLIEAKEQAEESDRLKSAFLASISHEIRTPLNAIVGFASLITMDMPKNYQGYYEIIRQNSDILTNLIDDILDSSKIEAGLLNIKISECSSNTLCTSIIQRFQQLISHKIELTFAEPSEAIVFQTDAAKLKQILDNLFSNAIKFTSSGEITLSCHAKKDSIIFSIQDTGIGIPESKFKDIFNRFTKIDPYIQGTGLGLSISKRLVEMLGGNIRVESELEVGSTFFVELPLNFPS